MNKGSQKGEHREKKKSCFDPPTPFSSSYLLEEALREEVGDNSKDHDAHRAQDLLDLLHTQLHEKAQNMIERDRIRINNIRKT